MPSDHLLRNALEVAVIIALGGMVWSAFRRLRAGQVEVHLCPACARPTSRAYPECRHCGAAVSGSPRGHDDD